MRKPKMEAVTIKNLDTDLYQRTLNMDFVGNIAAEWDIAKAGLIVVSRRSNGKEYVIDGQHRVAAALRAKETEILAQVFEGLSLKQEAELRLAANHRKAEPIHERFKARIVAEDPIALGILKAIEDSGGEIRLSSYSGRDHFVALAAAEKLYNHDGTGKHLRLVLHVLGEAFGVATSENASGAMLQAIGYLLILHPEADLDRLIEKLKEEGPIAMNRRASGHRALFGGSQWINWYRAATEVYNHRLGASKRLEWKGTRHKLDQPKQMEEAPDDGASEAQDKEGEDADDGGTD